MKTNKVVLSRDQNGFASVVIAMVMIIVLALITIGFAQLARREQQNSLDRQLASQAQLAAETGINDVIRAFKDNPASIPDGFENKCLDPSLLPSTISANLDVTYSCVMVNKYPGDNKQENIGEGQSRNFTFKTDGALSSLTVSWNSTTPANNKSKPGLMNFQPTNSWQWPAVVQVSITPLGPDAFNRASLTAGTFTAYLYPSTSGGNVNYNVTPAGQAPRVAAKDCDPSATGYRPCVAINNIPGAPGDYYLVHIVSYLDDSDILTDKLTEAATGRKLRFIDGQIVVDVTGKARNVLKRLQARVPANIDERRVDYPGDAMDVNTSCKRLETDPDGTGFTDTGSGDPNGCNFDL